MKGSRSPGNERSPSVARFSVAQLLQSPSKISHLSIKGRYELHKTQMDIVNENNKLRQLAQSEEVKVQ